MGEICFSEFQKNIIIGKIGYHINIPSLFFKKYLCPASWAFTKWRICPLYLVLLLHVPIGIWSLQYFSFFTFSYFIAVDMLFKNTSRSTILGIISCIFLRFSYMQLNIYHTSVEGTIITLFTPLVLIIKLRLFQLFNINVVIIFLIFSFWLNFFYTGKHIENESNLIDFYKCLIKRQDLWKNRKKKKNL